MSDLNTDDPGDGLPPVEGLDDETVRRGAEVGDPAAVQEAVRRGLLPEWEGEQ